jgi:hypothetical protein
VETNHPDVPSDVSDVDGGDPNTINVVVGGIKPLKREGRNFLDKKEPLRDSPSDAPTETPTTVLVPQLIVLLTGSTIVPIAAPMTDTPTEGPTMLPTGPSIVPIATPMTDKPTEGPTMLPTGPSIVPIATPMTDKPTEGPTMLPTGPSIVPIATPMTPTPPSIQPTTKVPTRVQSCPGPSRRPTVQPTTKVPTFFQTGINFPTRHPLTSTNFPIFRYPISLSILPAKYPTRKPSLYPNLKPVGIQYGYPTKPPTKRALM